MDNIKKLAKKLSNMYETMYQQVESQVNDIINKNITDINTIEHCLDYILGIPTDKGWNLFQRLASYYMIINKGNALSYLEIYKEMYDIKLKTKKRT